MTDCQRNLNLVQKNVIQRRNLRLGLALEANVFSNWPLFAAMI